MCAIIKFYASSGQRIQTWTWMGCSMWSNNSLTASAEKCLGDTTIDLGMCASLCPLSASPVSVCRCRRNSNATIFLLSAWNSIQTLLDMPHWHSGHYLTEFMRSRKWINETINMLKIVSVLFIWVVRQATLASIPCRRNWIESLTIKWAVVATDRMDRSFFNRSIDARQNNAH